MKFDVLIIYSGQIANSPTGKNHTKPFDYPKEYYNLAYEYFLSLCKKYSISTALSTSNEIIGPGKVSAYWIFNGSRWEKYVDEAFARVVFNKFTPINKIEEKYFNTLFSKKNIIPFTNPLLLNLFRDKYNTYKKFKNVAIPTALIGDFKEQNFENAKVKLEKLMTKNKFIDDFTSDFVIKDRFGAGGFQVIKVLSSTSFQDVNDKLKIEKKDTGITKYILQPFVKCDKGLVIGEHHGTIDARVIILNGKLIQSFIRVAKKGDFRANLHQGGKSFTLTFSDIPKDVLKMALRINKQVNIPHALYSLDFMKSNNGNVFLLKEIQLPE